MEEVPCGFQGLNGLYLSGDFGLVLSTALCDAFSMGADSARDVELLLLGLPAVLLLDLADVADEARFISVEGEDVLGDVDTVLEPCGFHGEKGLLASGAFGLLLPNALYVTF